MGSKGGGAKSNAGGMLSMSGRQIGYSQQLDELANRLYNQAFNTQQEYQRPIWDQIMGVLGFGTQNKGSGKWAYPEGGGQESFESNLFQLPKFTMQKQVAAAKKNIANTPLYGPIQKTMLSGGVDIQGMQGLQTNALSTVQNLIQQMMSATQASYNADIGGGQGLKGLSLNAMQSAGQMEAGAAAAQQNAQRINMESQSGMFKGLGSIAGTLFGVGMAAMGGPAGMLGSLGLGGGASTIGAASAAPAAGAAMDPSWFSGGF
jgi:hypothetical protein